MSAKRNKWGVQNFRWPLNVVEEHQGVPVHDGQATQLPVHDAVVVDVMVASAHGVYVAYGHGVTHAVGLVHDGQAGGV